MRSTLAVKLVNKESCDSTKPYSGADQPMTRDRLQSKIEEMKWNKKSPYNGSTESHYQSDNHLGESFIPPQMIDSSAILFTNNKKKKPYRNNDGPLPGKEQAETIPDDKSMVQLGGKSENTRNDQATEGENDSGEGDSSSCSCSSCLREKNADNAVSLKLSQYSYLPTKGQVRNLTDNDSHHYESDEVREDDLAYDVTPRTKQIKTDYPDNLNNGVYKMGVTT